MTIPSGVIVKPTGDYGIYVEGELNATEAAFTSYKDDSIGGDTNGDGETSPYSSPHAGDWKGISFRTGSKGVLDGVVVRYGGSDSEEYYGQILIHSDDVEIRNSVVSDDSYAGIRVYAASPVIRDNNIHNNRIYSCGSQAGCGGYGIHLSDSGATVTGNQITGNYREGILVDGDSPASLTISGNRVYGNATRGSTSYWYSGSGIVVSGCSDALITGNAGTDSVVIAGGQLTTERTWDASHPWIIGPLTIEKGGKLTISENAVVKMSGSVYAGIYVDGELSATGVVFTSQKDDTAGGDTNRNGDETSPRAGDWKGINFRAGSRGLLDGVVVRYGGLRKTYDSPLGQIHIQSDDVTVKNSIVMDGGRSGIYVTDASPVISNNKVTGHVHINSDLPGGDGIHLRNSASSVRGNEVTGNHDAGIRLHNSPDAVISGNRVYGNGNEYEKGIFATSSANAQFIGNAGTPTETETRVCQNQGTGMPLSSKKDREACWTE